MNIQTNDIGHVIQLAIAPVFLLTGVATKLTVLTNRLARIIDRTRVLEDRLRKWRTTTECVAELDVLYRRCALINYAITLQHRLRLPDLRDHRHACSSATPPTCRSTNTSPACSCWRCAA